MAVPVQTALSSSTNGRPIPVVAVATAGTNLHTAGASGYEKVWLFASNITAAVATLTVEWGGVVDPGDHLVKGYSIPPNSGPIPIATGQIIQASLSIKAFSGTASAINITGYAIAVR
jgi:hypothetical protein